MASGFGKIVVGTYVEIKRSDGKFYPVFSLAVSLCKLFGELCCCGAVECSNPWCWLQSETFALAET